MHSHLAVKRLRLTDGTILTDQLLAIAPDGTVLHYEPLTCEHPFTVWYRGTYELTQPSSRSPITSVKPTPSGPNCQ